MSSKRKIKKGKLERLRVANVIPLIYIIMKMKLISAPICPFLLHSCPAYFNPSDGSDRVEDTEDTCIDEKNDTEALGILKFVLLGRIVSGDGCSHDKK